LAACRLEGPTGIALILVGGDGENVIVVIPGANGQVSAQDAGDAVAAMSAGRHRWFADGNPRSCRARGA
jgi:sugar/nucleoside kinase (ribokinase family)